MLIAAGTLLLLIMIFGPQLWTRYVLKKYSTPIDELPGTGGELARHLLDNLEIEDSQVAVTEPGNDHYDPESRTVRLSPENFEGKSLTAVAVAAHEVGHALQHKLRYPPLELRRRLARFAALAEKLAAMMLVSVPLLALLVKVPMVGGFMLLAGLSVMLIPVLLHLVTLPVEIDASFGRALPILRRGGYLPESAMPIARRILTAAAMTYLAASLASLLNFYRWLAILRR